MASSSDPLHNILLFYLHERTWVYRTRAAHELAQAQLTQLQFPIPPAPVSPDASAASCSTLASTDSDPSQSPPIKTEDLPHTVPLDSQSPPPRSQAQSRWLQRKKSFRLRLEGVPLNTTRLLPQSHQPHNRRRRHKPHPSVATSLDSVEENENDPGAKLLQLFGDLVDARMESCQRLSNLVRDSNLPLQNYC